MGLSSLSKANNKHSGWRQPYLPGEAWADTKVLQKVVVALGQLIDQNVEVRVGFVGLDPSACR